MAALDLLRTAFEHMGQGLMLFDRTARLAVMNPACARMLDIPEALQAPGTERLAIVRFMVERGDYGAADGEDVLERLCQPMEVGTETLEERRLANGRMVRERLTGLPDGAILQGYSDVTEYHRLAATLQRHALYDGLTQLPNRMLFQDRLAQLAETAGDAEGAFAVVLIDLDRFKRINDSLGHAVGDEILVSAARRLRQSLQPGDTVARLSGDDFGILLSGTRARGSILALTEWLSQELATPFRVNDQEIYLTCSIGIALSQDVGARGDAVLQAAGIALERAKSLGKNRCLVFSPSMARRAAQALTLESDLRRAITRREIVPHYQPIIDLRSGRIASFEALLRWHHPERGLVAPADFIPVAEETGMIVDLGMQALEASCQQMALWLAELGPRAPGHVSVNLSARQLDDPSLVKSVEAELVRNGLQGSHLKLEVTESVILGNPEQAARTLSDLKRLGVALSIDDFGTGYSSLSYLHRFPFDTIKIDKSFVMAMDQRPENREIVRIIAQLAHSLGMDLVAEGVEAQRTLRELQMLDCEFAQGFLFARAEEGERATALLTARAAFDMGLVA